MHAYPEVPDPSGPLAPEAVEAIARPFASSLLPCARLGGDELAGT